MNRLPALAAALLATVILAACKPVVQPLQYGVHECDYCRMTLVEERYGGELVTRTGKVYTFDSVECLVAYVQENQVPTKDIHGTYVVDYSVPQQLISVADARFLKSTQLLSPMGANITAFSRDQDVHGAQNVFGGQVISWDEVHNLVRTEWGGRRKVPTPDSTS